eukprot:TRINITY_DN6665_c0_g1_i2.p1 TRINITY_DN6665_c0_g1~~TRINITY_DN6665_c0_g1_i2.p1  ORF type:complete len:238 (-),score=33.42 TRINITY_DN6665_c0_g1_i2:275-988(-)
MNCTMREYIAAFDQLKATSVETGEDVAYLRSWEIGQHRQEMLEAASEGFEYFEDMFTKLPPSAMVKPPFSWLFIGPAGSYTGVHADAVSSKLFQHGTLTVDAWTAILQGKKLFRLWSPSMLTKLFVGKISGHYGSREFVDMTNPDMERFPECMQQPPIHIVVRQGEVIYIPKNWGHDVLALSDTISLTTHWLTKFNLRQLIQKAKAAKEEIQSENNSLMDRVRALKQARQAQTKPEP